MRFIQLEFASWGKAAHRIENKFYFKIYKLPQPSGGFFISLMGNGVL